PPNSPPLPSTTLFRSRNFVMFIRPQRMTIAAGPVRAAEARVREPCEGAHAEHDNRQRTRKQRQHESRSTFFRLIEPAHRIIFPTDNFLHQAAAQLPASSSCEFDSRNFRSVMTALPSCSGRYSIIIQPAGSTMKYWRSRTGSKPLKNAL